MKDKSQMIANLDSLLRLAFNQVGPEGCLDAPDDKKYPFHKDDNIRFTERYLRMGFKFRDSILEKIDYCKGRTNSTFGYEIFNLLCHELYQRLIKRCDKLDRTLDNYLTSDDFNFAATCLERMLKKTKNEFRIILISDLISLQEIDSIIIGKTKITKIDNNYLKSLPDEIDQKDILLGDIWEHSKQYVSKSDFHEKHKDHTALELDIEGFHCDRERSAVYNEAQEEFRRVFAYLFMCSHYLRNLRDDPYNIEIDEPKRSLAFDLYGQSNLQDYYICVKDNYSFLKKLDTWAARNALSNKKFILSEESINKIKSRCCPEQFNKMSQDKNAWGLKNKIQRALDWFLKAILDNDETDMCIDLFISLESLLSSGGDPLTSHTDDMAENTAIMLTANRDERYEYKKIFKKEIYRLRCKIMHGGHKFNYVEDWMNRDRLMNCVVWSLRGILFRLDDIIKYGKKDEALKEYFERAKLK